MRDSEATSEYWDFWIYGVFLQFDFTGLTLTHVQGWLR
jgi:hypothetical protein